MQPKDNLEQQIINLQHQADAETQQRIFSRIRQALNEDQKQQTAHMQPHIWSTIMQNRIIKYAAAAVIIIGVLVTVSFLGGSPDGAQVAWAKVLEAFNNVQQVQVVSNKLMPDGSTVTHKFCLRRPDCIYEDKTNSTIIDNGQERLVLFKNKKEAAFLPSRIDRFPVSNHTVFKIIGLFQNETLEGMTITLLEDESNKTTIVYTMDYIRPIDQLTWQGKAWVDAETNLPIKISAALTSTPDSPQEHLSEEGAFSYDPIGNDIFELTVPEGYKIIK
ncbi:MAG: hypothetical protein AMJ79_06535 [Phycisphaerae bacterium SM23_30]|nr:MAG: hypothetical protein AMJ79_06535 [Phycisphaerae bacterium SM23_30]